MYTVERKADGLPQAIRRLVEGGERPVDGQDEYVEAFANVVINHDHLVARGNPWLPPIDVLFETRDEVVRFCKDHVARLVVRRDDPGRAAFDHGRSAQTPQGTGRLFSLLTATAPWPGSVAAIPYVLTR